MQKPIYILIYLLVTFSIISQDSLVNFNWAMFLVRDGSQEMEIINFDKPAVLKKNDSIRFLIEPKNDSYIYLILLDSSKDLTVLFPYEFGDIESDYANNKFYIPDENSWFEIDENKGTEEFYLIAANERLLNLEQKCETYDKEINSFWKNERKINNAKRAVLSEIVNLRKQNSDNVAIAEKPVSTAGTTRSVKERPSSQKKGNITEVKAVKFYEKTLRLEH